MVTTKRKKRTSVPKPNHPTLGYRNLLGEIVTWDIRGYAIPLDVLRTNMKDAGIDPTKLPDLHMKNAFLRAARGLKKDRLIDQVKAEGDTITFQLTSKVKHENMIEHLYECLVTLDVNTGKIACPEDQAIAREARRLFSVAMETRTSPDVSRLVQRLFEHHADLFPINPRKGVAYFVPFEHRAFIVQVEKFLTSCGGVVHRFPVPNGTDAGNASVKKAVQAGLNSMTRELEEAISQWDGTTRRDTKERAVAKLEEILHKHETYAHYLGKQQDEAKKRAAEIKAKIVDSLSKEEAPEKAEYVPF